MKEAKFCVEFDGGVITVINLNIEAKDVWNEFNNTFSGQSILKFILMSPNSMHMIKGELFYDVDLEDKDEVFDEMKYLL